jgi:tetratricopeptide (TPR) repeat protein
MKKLLLSCLALCLLALPAHAQDAPPASTAVRLDGIMAVFQDTNRCSAAALTIQLSYFLGDRPYDAVVRGLNPHIEDVSTRLDEMAALAEYYGLRGIVRYGGTLDILKDMIDAGFPVLVENVYYEGDGGFDAWLSHNRVVMGYDDTTQEILTFDPLLGNGENDLGRPIPYAEIDERWRPFNRDFLVLYRPEDEATLQAALGEHWDKLYNDEWAFTLSMNEMGTETADSFTLFNMGSSLVELGRYAEAADAFDQARAIGLPWRMMWYQFGPFDAYLQTERYQDVIDIAREVIAGTSGVEEVYYYAATAYAALGDTLRAEANFEVAIMRNRYYAAPYLGLAALRGNEAPNIPTPAEAL